MKPTLLRKFILLPLLILSGLQLAITDAQAATITVNSTADGADAAPGDGICETAAGNAVCTLRAAIQEAAAGDTVSADVDGVISLDPALGELLINKNLIVAGPGAANLTIDGNNAVRVLKISGVGLNVTVSGLTITRGFAASTCTGGGGIYNSAGGSRTETGIVTIDACVITENTADYTGCYAGGGGIYDDNYGTLRIINSTVSSNKVSGTGSGSGFGGGVYHGSGALEVSNSSISGNSSRAQTGNFGGGLSIGGRSASFTGGSVISNNTATGGSNDGGGIRSTVQMLTISNATISGNVLNGTGLASRNVGAGMSHGAAATITDTTISGNTIQGIGAPEGAAIYAYTVGSAGTTVTNCTISDNKALSTAVRSGFTFPPSAFGGAIKNTGTLTILGSQITNNLAQANGGNRGGAIYVDPPGTVNITNSVLSGNQALSTNQTYSDTMLGGAIFVFGASNNPAVVNVTGSTFSGNSAIAGTTQAGGGAIFSDGGTVNIRESTVAANKATSDSIYHDSSGQPTTDPTAIGGGIVAVGGSLTVSNSTIGNNAVSSPTTSGVIVQGGGIYVGRWFLAYSAAQPTVLDLNNSTVAGNAAGSGAEQGRGGGVFNVNATASVDDTIIALNTATTAGRDVHGAFVSGGYNLIGSGDGSTGFANGTNGDQVGTSESPIDPKLAALANYGGRTETFALQIGSPAINGGDPGFDASAFTPAMTMDQHGRPRVRGGRLDIGAYEAAPAPVLTAPAPGARTTATPTLTVETEPFSTVTFTIIKASDSSTVTITQIADGNGNLSVTSPALSEDSYSVSAIARFGGEPASPPSESRTFVVDATPPVISGVPGNITVEATGPNGAAVSYTQPTATDNVDGSVPVTCAPASGSTFAVGVTRVTCSASDAAGNTAFGHFDVTVQDTTAPVISNVPSNITTTATDSDGAFVTYDSPTASDAVSGNVPVNCTPASGSKFPIGTTIVTCSASDAAGNSASASFTVTVEEATPTPTPSPTASPSPSPSPSATPAQPVNISTRVNVGTGSNVMIGGFIITGDAAKKVILRGIGPSTGMDGALADPVLELNGPDGFATITNNDWEDSQKDEIEQTGIAPKNPREAAIVVTLQPGAYTGIVRGRDNTTGIGVVEVYDLSLGAPSQLANISTRGFVQTDDSVIIGGFILGGSAGDEVNVIVRAIGPSLADAGVANALANPALDIRDKDGNPVASNDDWQDDPNSAKVAQAEVAPTDERESALYLSLPPGQYTAIVSGEGSSTGVGLVEIYHVQ